MTHKLGPHLQFTERDVILGDALWGASLNGTPAGQHQAAWMREIAPGDVVIEWTSRYQPWVNRIGVLVREYYVPLFDEDGLAYGNDHHWVIKTNDGEFDWHNASLFRIPVTVHQKQLFQGHADHCSLPCRDCDRERWLRKIEGARWEQVLR